jgi:hypothetical protein
MIRLYTAPTPNGRIASDDTNRDDDAHGTRGK